MGVGWVHIFGGESGKRGPGTLPDSDVSVEAVQAWTPCRVPYNESSATHRFVLRTPARHNHNGAYLYKVSMGGGHALCSTELFTRSLIQYSQPARPPTGAPEAWPVGYGLCGPSSGLAGIAPGRLGLPRLFRPCCRESQPCRREFQPCRRDFQPCRTVFRPCHRGRRIFRPCLGYCGHVAGNSNLGWVGCIPQSNPAPRILVPYIL